MPGDEQDLATRSESAIASALDRRLARSQAAAADLADEALSLASSGVETPRARLLLQQAARLEHDLFGIRAETAKRDTALDRERQLAAELARQAAAIEGLARALSDALTRDEVAAAIVTEALDVLQAQSVSMWLPGSSGDRLELVASINLPEATRRQVATITLDAQLPVAFAYREAVPVFLDSLESISVHYHDALAAAWQMPCAAMAAVPCTIGADVSAILAFSYEAPHEFDDSERRIASTIGPLCAQALARARLHDSTMALQAASDAARRDADALALRLARLQRMSSALCSAVTEAEVADVVISEGFAASGAIGGGVALLSDDNAEFITLRHAGIQPQLMPRFARFPRSTACMARDVLELGALFMNFDQYVAAYPTIELTRIAPWLGARAAVPLRTEQRTIGVLTFIFEDDRSFDAEERLFFAALADQCALALERGKRASANATGGRH